MMKMLLVMQIVVLMMGVGSSTMPCWIFANVLSSPVCLCVAEFTVKVMAEDDSVLNTTTAAHLSMKMWKADSIKQNTPPPRVSTRYMAALSAS